MASERRGRQNATISEHMTPNPSLNRTRVRRASFGARWHAPVSLVRWASRQYVARSQQQQPLRV
jgi:hypothetical protein